MIQNTACFVCNSVKYNFIFYHIVIHIFSALYSESKGHSHWWLHEVVNKDGLTSPLLAPFSFSNITTIISSVVIRSYEQVIDCVDISEKVIQG